MAVPPIPRGPDRTTELGLSGLLRNAGLVETVAIADIDKEGRHFATAAPRTQVRPPPLSDDIIHRQGGGRATAARATASRAC